jgi:hypothetical protein
VNPWPLLSTATQKLDVGHDTPLSWVPESMPIGEVHVPPLSMTTFPDSSVAAQKVAEAHEMSVRFDPFAVSATCHEFIAVEASTSPSLSTAKQVAADTHDTALIAAWSFEYADRSIGLGYVQPPGPTAGPFDAVGLVVAGDALGDGGGVDAAALVVGGGVVAAASGVAWCIRVSPAAVPPPATTRTAAAIAAHIRRFRRGRSPLPGSGGTGGSTVVAPPEGGAVSHGACGGWSRAVGAVTQSGGRLATGSGDGRADGSLKGASWRAVGRSSKAGGAVWKEPWKKDGESWKGDCASGNGGAAPKGGAAGPDATSGVPIPLTGDIPLAGGGAPPTGVPQVRQNRASGAFSWPCGHSCRVLTPQIPQKAAPAGSR